MKRRETHAPEITAMQMRLQENFQAATFTAIATVRRLPDATLLSIPFVVR
jgi:hypothetical protein